MKPRRRLLRASGAMSEHPGLADARAWLVFDSTFSELLRCAVLLCPSLDWSMARWPLLFLLAFGCAAGAHLVLLRRSRIAGRRSAAAGVPMVLPAPPRASRSRALDAGWPIQFASLIAAMRLMVREAVREVGRIRGVVPWRPLRTVFARRAQELPCDRSAGTRGTDSAGRRQARIGSAHAPTPAISPLRPGARRPPARWPAGSLRRGLPAFMWRLLRAHSSVQSMSSLDPFATALPRVLPDALPDLTGRGIFVVLGPSGTASVLALSAEDSYEVTASEHGLRALAIRGLAVQGGIPLIEDVRLASRIADVAAPSPVPADCVLSVRLMAQWLREVAALSPQRCL